jgi:hypothetical protein
MRDSNRKANHSVIEKRRREKINTAMDNLKELTNGEVLRASKEKHGEVSEDDLDGGDGGEPAGGKAEFKLDVLEKYASFSSPLTPDLAGMFLTKSRSLSLRQDGRLYQISSRPH